MINRNWVKDKLNADETVMGIFSIISSPAFIEAIGYGGLDFVIIDAEHGPMSMETAENLVRAAELTGMSPIIRVPGNEPHLILKALDLGAHGVQVPHISTKREAELVVEYAKYNPLGKRGFSPFTRAGKYGTEADGYTSRANENTMIILNIEGTEGISNLKEIATVPCVDVIFIGPYDLSQSLGKPGKVDDPEVICMIKSSAEVLREEGVVCGSFANSKEYLEILVDCGIQYIAYMVDSALITQTFRALRESFPTLVAEKKKRHE